MTDLMRFRWEEEKESLEADALFFFESDSFTLDSLSLLAEELSVDELEMNFLKRERGGDAFFFFFVTVPLGGFTRNWGGGGGKFTFSFLSGTKALKSPSSLTKVREALWLAFFGEINAPSFLSWINCCCTSEQLSESLGEGFKICPMPFSLSEEDIVDTDRFFLPFFKLLVSFSVEMSLSASLSPSVGRGRHFSSVSLNTNCSTSIGLIFCFFFFVS